MTPGGGGGVRMRTKTCWFRNDNAGLDEMRDFLAECEDNDDWAVRQIVELGRLNVVVVLEETCLASPVHHGDDPH